MNFKAVKIIVIILLTISSSTFAQRSSGMKGNRQRQNNSPTETKQNSQEFKEKQLKKITKFIETLDAGDFQKEVIKQLLDSYFDKRKNILKSTQDLNEIDKEIQILNDSHFNDIKDISSQEIQDKIQQFITKNSIDLNKTKSSERKKRR